MKKLLLFYALFAFSGCTKYQRQERFYEKHGDIYNSGTITGKLNGEDVSFKIVNTFLNCDTCKTISLKAVLSSSIAGYGNQTLSIYTIDLFAKRQKIDPILIYHNDSVYLLNEQGKCFGTFYSDFGDVSSDSYSVLDSNTDNYVQIDSYNPSSPRIQGRFELTLFYPKMNLNQKKVNLPDTLRFTDCRFDVDIMMR